MTADNEAYEPLPRHAKLAMGWVALAWRNALIVGSPAPHVAGMWERTRNPRSGDLCMEVSTLYRLCSQADLTDDLWDGQFVPYVRTEDRPISATPGEWGVEVPTERVHIMLNPDGTEFAWTNAEIAAVPQMSTLGIGGHWVKPSPSTTT